MGAVGLWEGARQGNQYFARVPFLVNSWCVPLSRWPPRRHFEPTTLCFRTAQVKIYLHCFVMISILAVCSRDVSSLSREKSRSDLSEHSWVLTPAKHDWPSMGDEKSLKKLRPLRYSNDCEADFVSFKSIVSCQHTFRAAIIHVATSESQLWVILVAHRYQ